VNKYNTDFYRFLASPAVYSAEQIVSAVKSAAAARQLYRFGCGHGYWLSAWRKAVADLELFSNEVLWLGEFRV
jgi:hypothetical protein